MRPPYRGIILYGMHSFFYDDGFYLPYFNICKTQNPLEARLLFIQSIIDLFIYSFIYFYFYFFRLIRYGNPDEPIRLKYFKYTRDKVLNRKHTKCLSGFVIFLVFSNVNFDPTVTFLC